ncbi:SHOCT domain-containing protein [Salinisphaera japonica]|uniref:SHOCT domain-containing protein n=1 Tax=Salinisphaera japonica YTM-1 TaxID=1209778 RepID=A0A423PKF6_9GAMM|nr:SHOCT domain-containing protein [Salinisphaera japonica]ROO26084.1 hypothetical protein SAJA_11670 [Salinisphaera japonica YTM-1]
MDRSDNEARERLVDELADTHEFSRAAIAHLAEAITAGAGDMAMFDHPEFGGPGQWMRGGLILTSRPEDTILTHRIEALCNALSEQARASTSDRAPADSWSDVTDIMAPPDTAAMDAWWPAELGTPEATGSGDNLSYAYFRAAGRLAIRERGRLTLYDTGGADIIGIAQSQTDATSETVFTTPEGRLPLAELAPVDAAPAPAAEGPPADHDTILDTLERLGTLHAQGVLTDAEFMAKKQELLARL